MDICVGEQRLCPVRMRKAIIMRCPYFTCWSFTKPIAYWPWSRCRDSVPDIICGSAELSDMPGLCLVMGIKERLPSKLHVAFKLFSWLFLKNYCEQKSHSWMAPGHVGSLDDLSTLVIQDNKASLSHSVSCQDSRPLTLINSRSCWGRQHQWVSGGYTHRRWPQVG